MSYRYFMLIFVLASCQMSDSAPKRSVFPASLAKDRLTGETFLTLVKTHLTCDWNDETVDTFKEGDPRQAVTGIATTFMATQGVLQEAAANGLNLIVTHEPTFYNHLDSRDLIEHDAVYRSKLAFIEKHGLMIFRFHDHWHRTEPDGIYRGMIDELGWKSFQTEHKMIFEMPLMTLGKMAAQLASHFNSSTVRVLGSADMSIKSVGLCVGAHGAQTELGLLARPDVDLLIVGETREWETVEYVRDAQIQGKNKALILMGHADSEEAGMRHCASWLKSFIKGVDIQHLPAGNPLWSP